MTRQYLPIFFLLFSAQTFAKDTTGNTNNNTEITLNSGLATIKKAIARALPKYANGSTHVRFFYDIDLGYASMTSKVDLSTSAGPLGTTTIKGGGFMYGGELGMKISMPGRLPNRSRVISIAINGTAFTIKQKYTDATGASKTNKLKFAIAKLPLSYTSVIYGRYDDAIGFYLQGGVNICYMSKVTDDNDKKITDHYNTIYFEPTIGAGIHTLFKIRNTRTHEDIDAGRAYVGPFFSYAVLNMSKESGTTTHGFLVGMKWSYVFW